MQDETISTGFRECLQSDYRYYVPTAIVYHQFLKGIFGFLGLAKVKSNKTRLLKIYSLGTGIFLFSETVNNGLKSSEKFWYTTLLTSACMVPVTLCFYCVYAFNIAIKSGAAKGNLNDDEKKMLIQNHLEKSLERAKNPCSWYLYYILYNVVAMSISAIFLSTIYAPCKSEAISISTEAYKSVLVPMSSAYGIIMGVQGGLMSLIKIGCVKVEADNRQESSKEMDKRGEV
jgi:hypothetical protein